MAGPLRITFTDIDAWQRVTGVRIEPWEVEALRRADSAFMADQAGRRAK